jgi:two-component system, LytTR family, sensor kinase
MIRESPHRGLGGFSMERTFKLLFLILFFGIWLALPVFSVDFNDDKSMTFVKGITLVNLTSIVLFFINTEVLMPRIFQRYGVSSYVVSLILLIVVFTIIQYSMKEWLLPFRKSGQEFNLGRFVAFNVFPVIMIAAISAVYGFINYYSSQSKIQQEEKQERLQSELSFLRSQISPHFIFNVLNSIVYLIRTKSNNAETVTIQLSELMRYMLYETDNQQVPLEKEVLYLENYIELQRVRFEDDVQINFKVEGKIDALMIEPMLLIPFVENAFKHGVGLIQNPVIDVFVSCQNNTMKSNIKNKIAPESVENKDGSSGIGLKNVKRRLELLYPNQHQFSASERGDWFEVELLLNLKEG